MKGICIFERDERYTDSEQPELDWRPVRAILPAGSAPIAMVAEDGTVAQWEAQHFSMVEVAAYMATLGVKSKMVEA